MARAEAALKLERILWKTTLVYASGILLLKIIWATSFAGWWLCVLLRLAPAVLYPVIPALLAISCLVSRGWKSLGVNLATICVILLFFVRPALNVSSVSPATNDIRVLTYNIDGGLEGIDKVIATIKAADVDVVVLQEASNRDRGKIPDPLPPLRAALPGWHSARGNQTPELAVLTRFDIRDSKELSLGVLRNAFVCTISTERKRLRVVDVHFNTTVVHESLSGSGSHFAAYLEDTARIRTKRAESLAGIVATSNVPTIVAGDFNTPPDSDVHELLSKTMTDSFEAAGFGLGPTYSINHPLWRIDYIWCGNGLIARSSAVITDVPGSDHRPLRSTFSVP